MPKRTRAGAEDVEVRLPGRVGEEAEAELRDRGTGAVDDLVRRSRSDARRPPAGRRERRRRREAVAEPVDLLAPLSRPPGAGSGAARLPGSARGAHRARSVERALSPVSRSQRIFTELTQGRYRSPCATSLKPVTFHTIETFCRLDRATDASRKRPGDPVGLWQRITSRKESLLIRNRLLGLSIAVARRSVAWRPSRPPLPRPQASPAPARRWSRR